MTHDCGGTILGGAGLGTGHIYCTRCGAYVLLDPRRIYPPYTLPTGTDPEKNGAAWEAGETRSPDAS